MSQYEKMWTIGKIPTLTHWCLSCQSTKFSKFSVLRMRFILRLGISWECSRLHCSNFQTIDAYKHCLYVYACCFFSYGALSVVFALTLWQLPYIIFVYVYFFSLFFWSTVFALTLRQLLYSMFVYVSLMLFFFFWSTLTLQSWWVLVCPPHIPYGLQWTPVDSLHSQVY